MDTKLEFTLMKKDEPLVEVVYDYKTQTLTTDYITKDPYDSLVLGYYRPTELEDIQAWIETRCFPRSRVDAEFLLKELGLSTYHPLSIVKITHGHTPEDFYWIRFSGETLTWDEINLFKT